MLFITTYKVKSHLTQAERKRLLDLFMEHGAAPGTIAHYVSADNSAGWVVAEAEDATGGYAATLTYAEFIEFETKPVLTIEEAVPLLLESIK
jgi:hypothetical protein